MPKKVGTTKKKAAKKKTVAKKRAVKKKTAAKKRAVKKATTKRKAAKKKEKPPVTKAERKDGPIIRTQKMELLKPLSEGHTWDGVGPVLRAQRYVTKQLLDAAIIGSIESFSRIRNGESEGRFKQKTVQNADGTTTVLEPTPGCPGESTNSYRAVGAEARELMSWGQERLAEEIENDRIKNEKEEDRKAKLAAKKKRSRKKLTPKQEQEAAEKEKEAEERAAKAAKNRMSQIRFFGEIATLNLGSEIQGSIARMADAYFREWKKDRRGKRIPSWKKGASLPMRKRAVKLTIEKYKGADYPVLLLAHKTGMTVKWAVGGKGAYIGRLLEIARGDNGITTGDCKIKYDERQKKWFAHLSYYEPQPNIPCDPKNVMVLHRGQRHFLVAHTSTGQYTVVANGGALRAYKRKMKARRMSVQAIRRAERGNGAHGHGRRRRYKINDALADKEARYIKTFIQQTAARAVELALRYGCGSVYIENYGGIQPDDDKYKRRFMERFPNYELKLAVQHACEKAGLLFGEYEQRYISAKCTKCGNVDVTQHNTRTGVFHCKNEKCKDERGVDYVASLNALRSVMAEVAGKKCDVIDKQLEAEYELTDKLEGMRP